MRKYLVYAMVIGALSGCSENSRAFDELPGNQVEKAQLLGGDPKEDGASGQSLCPDDGQTLPLTGICEDRATNYLNIVGGDVPQLPDNCHWSVNETAIVDQVLLYLAATCDGKKARLGYAGGARFSALSLAWSAVANEVLEDTILIRIGSAEADRPYQNILFYAQDAMDDSAEAEKCLVRPAGLAGWPADALVVDVGPEEAAKAPSDEPRIACGLFGLDEDNSSYWRVFQGYSWWFQFSQDAYQDIDPRSLTLVRPDGSGGWKTVE
tara:strand:+ start:2461 stop:3258 length:798 start_codon:yes stop_codon:yes gene_type:complete